MWKIPLGSFLCLHTFAWPPCSAAFASLFPWPSIRNNLFAARSRPRFLLLLFCNGFRVFAVAQQHNRAHTAAGQRNGNDLHKID